MKLRQSFCFACLILTAFVSVNASAQKTPAKTAPPFLTETVTKQQDFLDRMERVRNVVERAKTMSNIYFRVQAITGIAETVWRHDKNYAEEILLETYQSLLPTVSKRSSGNFVSRKTELNLSPEGRLRAQIRAVLLRLSPRAVNKLGKATESEELQLSGIEAVRSAVEGGDADQIKKFWADSLANGVSGETTMSLNSFRYQNRGIADMLFLQTLASLSSQTAISGDLLNELAGYVFTHDAQNREQRGGWTMGVVGKVLVAVLSEPRGEVSPQITRAFLQFAADVLTRQASEPKEKEIYYVTAYQLLPHFSAFAPELENSVSGAMRRLLSEIPEIYARPETYRFINSNVGKAQNYASAEYEKTIEQMRDADQKDFYCLQAVSRLYQSGDFARARFYAEQIANVFLLERVRNLINFAESIAALKENKVSAAIERAEKMSKSLETAVLWLEIANAQIKAKNLLGAREGLLNIDRTLRDAGDADSALVRLRAAELFAKINDYAAFINLSEVIKIYNRISTKESYSVGWRVKLETEHTKKQGRDVPIYFNLYNAEKPGFSKSLEPLLKLDKFAVESAIADLKNEVVLPSALAALAKYYLNSVNEKPRKKTTESTTS